MSSNTETIRVINNSPEVKEIYLNLIRTSSYEILLIFPTINAIRREEKIGVIDELINASKRKIKVRILSPEDEFVSDVLEKLRANHIDVRMIENPSESKFKLLIVDRKLTLVVETKDDSKAEFLKAIGSATFSNSKASVLPYVGIFESFWRETELYNKARDAEMIKDDFINIAAHELRNPLAPIIGSIEDLQADLELLVDSITDRQLKENISSALHIILRNAVRLIQLSEDILQISKIESGTFSVKMESFDINMLITQVISDMKKKYIGERKEVQYIFKPNLHNQDDGAFIVVYDQLKIQQAIFNLLDNASKYTLKGEITISTHFRDNEITLNVKDRGTGIDPTIQDALFTKFTSKSTKGTGLGLYITRKIIEAHGGKIRGENNTDGKGATFSFVLPVKTSVDF